jgi:hypothetical protein
MDKGHECRSREEISHKLMTSMSRCDGTDDVFGISESVRNFDEVLG